MGATKVSNAGALVLIVLLWYILSSGYSLYAKAGLSLDPTASDSVLTLWQFVFGVVGSLLVLRGDVNPILQELREGGALLLAIAAAYCVGAALTSASMAMGSVAIAYVVKSTEPLVSVSLSRVVLGQRYSGRTLLALAPLCVGLVLACYSPSGKGSGDDGAGQWVGALLALAANGGMAVRNVCTKLRQHAHQHQAGANGGGAKRIVSVMAEDLAEAGLGNAVADAASPSSSDDSSHSAREPNRSGVGKGEAGNGVATAAARFGALSAWALVLGLLLVLLDPTGRSQAHVATIGSRLLGGKASADWMLLVSAACHAGYTLCSFAALGRLEAASHAVATALKQLFVIACAALLLGGTLTQLQWLGTALAIAGVVAYGRARASDPLASHLQPSAAVGRLQDAWMPVAFACLSTIALVVLLRPHR